MAHSFKILILGGTRFIGHALTKALSVDPTNLIYVYHRGIHEPEFHSSNIVHIHGDRNSKDEMSLLREHFYDYVFDISGESFNIIKLSVDLLKDKIGKYIYCSSSSVYSPKLNSHYYEDDKLDLFSNKEYTRQKVLSELYISSNINTYTILRPSKVYGPNNYIQRERWYFDKIYNGECIFVNNNPMIHLTFIDDVIYGIIKAMDKTLDNNIYNISGPEYISLTDYILLIGKIVNKEVFISNADSSCEAPYTNVDSRIIDHQKLLYTGWYPKVCIKDGLIETFKTYEQF